MKTVSNACHHISVTQHKFYHVFGLWHIENYDHHCHQMENSSDQNAYNIYHFPYAMESGMDAMEISYTVDHESLGQGGSHKIPWGTISSQELSS
ncbi:hypothetical protein XELAEV_18020579mg [Xenopus laevis]|uniref:Uncharacterized protein n=1 Tax=Xenopus laevis TaxID=8355 RepID=A0A974D775_XENLA|nr:hypothetical protein XELAEV_18020579mg [Xenopus laevis]